MKSSLRKINWYRDVFHITYLDSYNLLHLANDKWSMATVYSLNIILIRGIRTDNLNFVNSHFLNVGYQEQTSAIDVAIPRYFSRNSSQFFL